MQDFPNRVREQRAIIGKGQLTQQALAEAAGISVGTLSEIEAGKRDLRVGTAQRIAQALGVSLDALFLPADVPATGTDRPDSGTAAASGGQADGTSALTPPARSSAPAGLVRGQAGEKSPTESVIATSTCRGCGAEFAITTDTLAAFRAADDVSAATYTDEQAIESIEFCESCAGVTA